MHKLMPMEKLQDSIEEIDNQFKQVLDKLGIAEEDRAKLEFKFTSKEKMDMVINLQTTHTKEKNIKVFLSNMQNQVSLLNLYSLRSTLKQSPPFFYELFKENNGIEILQNLLYEIRDYKSAYKCNNKNNNEIPVRDRPYNASQLTFPKFSRENVLDEHLNTIFLILEFNEKAYLDFDIRKIAKFAHFNKVYTKSFYDILEHYSQKDTSKLRFLFESNADTNHVCVVHTYFYDIFREDIENEIVKKLRKDPMLSSAVNYVIKNIEKERINNDAMKLDKKLENLSINENEQNKKINMEALKNSSKISCESIIANSDLEVKEEKRNLQFSLNMDIINERNIAKQKIEALIDNIDNPILISVIPCFIESFIFSNIDANLLDKIISLTEEKNLLKDELGNIQNRILKSKDNNDLIISVTKEIKEPPKINKTNTAGKPKPKPPSFRRAMKKETAKIPAIYASKKYCPISWKKIPKTDNLWEEISKNINYEELSTIFTIENLQPFENAEKNASKEEKVRILKCFEDKKGNAIGIVLARNKISDEDFYSGVLNIEVSLFDENLIRQFINHYPTDNEIEHLKKLGRPKANEKIARAEDFFYGIIDIHKEFLRKLKIIFFKLTFLNNYNSVIKGIDQSAQIYIALMQSEALKEFLTVTLFLGNVFNGTSALGNAEGYAIESINEFINYKSNNTRLIPKIKASLKHNLLADLKITTGENAKFDFICGDMNEIVQSYSKIEKEDLGYIEEHIEKYNEIKIKFEEFSKLHGSFCKYFGEGDVFKTLLRLYNALKDEQDL